jgi:hypothetical protein
MRFRLNLFNSHFVSFYFFDISFLVYFMIPTCSCWTLAQMLSRLCFWLRFSSIKLFVCHLNKRVTFPHSNHSILSLSDSSLCLCCVSLCSIAFPRICGSSLCAFVLAHSCIAVSSFTAAYSTHSILKTSIVKQPLQLPHHISNRLYQPFLRLRALSTLVAAQARLPPTHLQAL